MSKKKYRVSLNFGGTDAQGRPLVRATTKVGNKALAATAINEALAVDQLKFEIGRAEEIAAMRASFPKTVEITV